jgi:hypothetical protein
MSFFSFNITVASGSTPNVAVPFPYQSKADVHVSLNGTLVADASLVWLNGGLIQLPSTPAAGTAVKVYRATKKDGLNTTFSSPAVLDPRDMNGVSTQLLYTTQEAFDLGNVTADELAAITDYVNTAMANTAASASAAATSASGAASSAGTATTQASASAGSASAAATSASGAAASAASILGAVTASAASATAAATSATNAAASAAAAAASASTATTQATSATSSATGASGSAGTATTQAGIATTQAGIATTKAGLAATSETNAASSASAAAASAVLAAGYAVGGLTFIGNWDASAGTFPGGGTAPKGAMYRVSVAGTVGGVLFLVGDCVLSVVLNPSTTTFAGNWIHDVGSINSAEIVSALGFTPMGNTVATGAQVTTGTDNALPVTAKAIADAGIKATRTGTYRFTIQTTADTGWVMLSDGTIGDGSSGATYANANAQALFLLYYACADADCPVQTSAGGATTRASQGTGAAAWAAHCRIKHPISLGHVVGVAGAGAGLTSRPLGGHTGSETTTLTAAQQASMAVTGSFSGSGSGSVTGSFSGGGSTSYNVPWYDGGGSGSLDTSANGPVYFLNPPTAVPVSVSGSISGTASVSVSGSISGTASGSGGAHSNVQNSVFLNMEVAL